MPPKTKGLKGCKLKSTKMLRMSLVQMYVTEDQGGITAVLNLLHSTYAEGLGHCEAGK
jgi:hypothetical protein